MRTLIEAVERLNENPKGVASCGCNEDTCSHCKGGHTAEEVGQTCKCCGNEIKLVDSVTKEAGMDDMDDYGLGGHGSELDRDDDGDGPGFKQASMYEQLGKILDSQGNPKPVTTVTTDDGKTLKVSADQARVLRMLMTTDKVKPMVRTQFIKDMQDSHALIDFLDIKDYHEMTALFVKRYLG